MSFDFIWVTAVTLGQVISCGLFIHYNRMWRLQNKLNLEFARNLHNAVTCQELTIQQIERMVNTLGLIAKIVEEQPTKPLETLS